MQNAAMAIEMDHPLQWSGLVFTDGGRGARFERILVATDFSPASDKAVKRAVALAGQCGCRLTVIHVVDINAQARQSESGVAEDMMGRLWNGASAGMDGVARMMDGQIDAEVEILEGLPWEKIVEKSADFDLVLLGHSCRKTMPAFFSRR